MDLVRTSREKVCIIFINLEGDFAEPLHTVHMNSGVRILSADPLDNLLDG